MRLRRELGFDRLLHHHRPGRRRDRLAAHLPPGRADDGVLLNLRVRVPRRAARSSRPSATDSPAAPSTSASSSTCSASRSRACRPASAIRCPTTGRTTSTRCARTGSRQRPTPGAAEQEATPWPSVTIPIGPQHPALKEPESFTITLEGERIVERRRAARLQPPRHREGLRGAHLHPGRLPHRAHLRHLLALALAPPSSRRSRRSPGSRSRRAALYIRTLIAELERIHSHLLWLGVAGHEIGFDTLLMYTWRDRELVMDLLAMLTGNRVNYGINTIGGVRRDVTAEQLAQVLQGRSTCSRSGPSTTSRSPRREPTLAKRLARRGHLSHEDAVRLGRGRPHRPAPRASTATCAATIPTWRTRDAPLQGHHRRPLRRLRPHAGARGRAAGVLHASSASSWPRCPTGPITVQGAAQGPGRRGAGRYEAPRGEDVHYVRGNGTDKPERVKVRAPTLANPPRSPRCWRTTTWPTCPSSSPPSTPASRAPTGPSR